MAAMFLDNLLHWTGQVMVIGALGLVLPLVLRVRHARTQLLYCHFLLAVCVLLPFIEPWRHPLTLIGHGTGITSTAGPIFVATHGAGVALPWNVIVLSILLAGAAARLCWLAVGLGQIRRYRVAATPLFPVPAALEAASTLTQTEALVCVSSAAPGPVTLGLVHPVVLLPESFLALGEEAQCGIVCHELLHVRRHDWLATVFEEVIGALLWFNPAIWWLLAQTRLAREQVVDQEVVRLTSARDPYLDALLALAGKRLEQDLAPAPSFLRRRHLTQRVHYLLKEAPTSRMRLLISYSSIAAILALAGWFALATLPLVGSAQVKMEALANSKEAHGILASIDVSALPEPLRSAAWEKVKTFEGQPLSNHLMRQVGEAAAGVDSHVALRWQFGKDRTATTLTIFLSPPFLPAPPYDYPALEPHISSQTAYPFPATGKPRVLMAGAAMAEKLVHEVEPLYPPQAEAVLIRGVVLLDVLIATDGSVAAVHLAQGDPVLAQSAIDAVKRRTYKPTTVGGNPVEVVTQVRVPFGMQ